MPCFFLFKQSRLISVFEVRMIAVIICITKQFDTSQNTKCYVEGFISSDYKGNHVKEAVSISNGPVIKRTKRSVLFSTMILFFWQGCSNSSVPTHVVTLTQVVTSVYLGQTHLGTPFQVFAWVIKSSLGSTRDDHFFGDVTYHQL